MKIYHFSPDTGEYLSEEEAHPNPLEAGQFLIPANATSIQPPALDAGKVRVFQKQEGEWAQVVDQRGVEYWLDDGILYTISEIGVTKPSDALNAPPAPTVEKLVGVLRAECGQRIMGVYGAKTLANEALYRLNNVGSLTSEDTERTRLIARCTDIEATIAALDESGRQTFDVTDDALWAAS